MRIWQACLVSKWFNMIYLAEPQASKIMKHMWFFPYFKFSTVWQFLCCLSVHGGHVDPFWEPLEASVFSTPPPQTIIFRILELLCQTGNILAPSGTTLEPTWSEFASSWTSRPKIYGKIQLVLLISNVVISSNCVLFLSPWVASGSISGASGDPFSFYPLPQTLMFAHLGVLLLSWEHLGTIRDHLGTILARF